jgi:hypothetical protein
VRYGWDANPESWSRLKVITSGRTWSRTYLEEHYRSSVPASPGIYVICAAATHMHLDGELLNGLYNAIYIGQSGNLRRRFCEHAGGTTPVRQALHTFRRLDYWFTVASPESLSVIEQSYIDALGPTCNRINVMATVGDPVRAGAPIRPNRR